MAFNLFGRKAKVTSENRFWQWFVKNEARLFTFEGDQESVFNDLSVAMHRVNSALTFEFSPVLENGKREFVISAGGIKSAFPAVEALYNQAPDLERWLWIKYRPRRNPIYEINFGDKNVKPRDVHYLLTPDGEKLGIVLFFENYSEEPQKIFEQIGYLFLDEALGEYAVETKIGFIEFHSRKSKYFSDASPLEDLPEHFDAYWRSRGH